MGQTHDDADTRVKANGIDRNQYRNRDQEANANQRPVLRLERKSSLNKVEASVSHSKFTEKVTRKKKPFEQVPNQNESVQFLVSEA